VIRLKRAGPEDLGPWSILRHALWDFETADQLAMQGAEALARGPADFATWLALDRAGAPIGFAEASVRRDYVNGCDTSPVAFLEGIYVEPAHRGRGLARALIAELEA
jgi:aminoglycoside 6'-N-acetyltransferase I